MKDIPSCDWLQQWTDLARRCSVIKILTCYQVCEFSQRMSMRSYIICELTEILKKNWFPHRWTTDEHVDIVCYRFAFQYNPALQPRAIIVFGCISKTVTDSEIKQLLKIMMKASVLMLLFLLVRTLKHTTTPSKHSVSFHAYRSAFCARIVSFHAGVVVVCFRVCSRFT